MHPFWVRGGEGSDALIITSMKTIIVGRLSKGKRRHWLEHTRRRLDTNTPYIAGNHCLRGAGALSFLWAPKNCCWGDIWPPRHAVTDCNICKRKSHFYISMRKLMQKLLQLVTLLINSHRNEC